MTLQIHPEMWFGWSFCAHRSGPAFAFIKVGGFRNIGLIELGGLHYTVHKRGPVRGAICLECAGTLAAIAFRRSPFRRVFEIGYAKQTYLLKPARLLGRRFLVLDGERVKGIVRPDGALSRTAIADVPDDWPPVLQLFVVLLVLRLWKRYPWAWFWQRLEAPWGTGVDE